LKASYTLLALAPKDWVVIANAPQIKETSESGSNAFTKQLQKYSIDEAKFTSYFGGEAVNCFEFGESYKLSTYLFCFVAGPYVCFESEKPAIKDFKVPLRMFSRKSIAKYAEQQKEEYFWVTKCGIEFYEKTFATPYPFQKLD
jgi:aminopeptidase N